MRLSELSGGPVRWAKPGRSGTSSGGSTGGGGCGCPGLAKRFLSIPIGALECPEAAPGYLVPLICGMDYFALIWNAETEKYESEYVDLSCGGEDIDDTRSVRAVFTVTDITKGNGTIVLEDEPEDEMDTAEIIATWKLDETWQPWKPVRIALQDDYDCTCVCVTFQDGVCMAPTLGRAGNTCGCGVHFGLLVTIGTGTTNPESPPTTPNTDCYCTDIAGSYYSPNTGVEFECGGIGGRLPTCPGQDPPPDSYIFAWDVLETGIQITMPQGVVYFFDFPEGMTKCSFVKSAVEYTVSTLVNEDGHCLYGDITIEPIVTDADGNPVGASNREVCGTPTPATPPPEGSCEGVGLWSTSTSTVPGYKHVQWAAGENTCEGDCPNCNPQPPFDLPNRWLTDAEYAAAGYDDGIVYPSGCECGDAYVPPEIPPEPGTCDCTEITTEPSFTIIATGAFITYTGSYTLGNDAECIWLGTNTNGVEATVQWSDALQIFTMLISGEAGNAYYEGGAGCPPSTFTRVSGGSGSMPTTITVTWS
jgi:hypothetical protein